LGQLQQDLLLGQADIDDQGQFVLNLKPIGASPQAEDYLNSRSIGPLVLLRASELPSPFESLTLFKVVHLEDEFLNETDTQLVDIDWISDWVSALSYYDVVPVQATEARTLESRSDAVVNSTALVDRVALVENAWTVERLQQSLAQTKRLLLGYQATTSTFAAGDLSSRYYLNQAWVALANASGLSPADYWLKQRRQLLLQYSEDSVEQRYFPGQWLLDTDDPQRLSLKPLLQQAQAWALKDQNKQQAQIYASRLLTLNQDELFMSETSAPVQSTLELPVAFPLAHCFTLNCKQGYVSLYQQAQHNLAALQRGDWAVLTERTVIGHWLTQLEKLKKRRQDLIEAQPLWHQALVRMGVALLNALQQNPESPFELGVFDPEAEVRLLLDERHKSFEWHWSLGVHQLTVEGRYQATEQDARQYRIELTQPLRFQTADMYWHTLPVQEAPADSAATGLVQPSQHFGYLLLLSDLTRNQVQYLSLHFPSWALYETNGDHNRRDNSTDEGRPPMVAGALEYGLQAVQPIATQTSEAKLPAYNFDAMHLRWRLFPAAQMTGIDEQQREGWQLSYEGTSQRATTFRPAQTYPALAIEANPWRVSGFLTPNDQVDAPTDWPDLLDVRWFGDQVVLPEGIQPFLDNTPIIEAAQLKDPAGETWLMLYADGRYQPCDLKPKWVCADPQPLSELTCLKHPTELNAGAGLEDIRLDSLRLEHIMNTLADQGCFSQVYVPGYGVYSVIGQQPLFSASLGEQQRFDGRLLYKDTLGLSNSYLNLAYQHQKTAKGFVWQLDAPVPGYRVETLAFAQGAADQQIYRPLPFGSETNLHWHQQQGTAKPSTQGFIKQQQSLTWKQHPLGLGTFLYDKGQLLGRVLDQNENGRQASKQVIFVDRGWLKLDL
jgi:hypothetical protein